MRDAKAFLKSLFGGMPTDSSWPKVLDVTHRCHFVSLPSIGKYECDCKGYWSSRECAHVAAAKHLDVVKDSNIHILLQSIDKPKTSGRPRIVAPVGYAAHQPVLTASSEIKAGNYIGARVARYLRGDKDRVYIGKIVGNKVCAPYDNLL
jgi:hypothetical protein